MSSDLERALSKLRFDDQVLGYSLMTKTGRPFVSFAFPDDLFPRVKDSINLYKSDLRLMTIDTEKGLVVLSPVDENWILTVLYVPELQLGLAIAKTKNVLRLLEGIELPPPPEDFEESADANLQVLESIAIKAASTTAEEAVHEIPAVEPAVQVPEAATTHSPDDFMIAATTVPRRGNTYGKALSLESDLYGEMKNQYRNFGFDVLMLVDGTLSVSQIADSMFQPTERVVELLKWAAGKGIVDAPVATKSQTKSSSGTMGKFVKVPKYTGDGQKLSDEEQKVLSLCDGNKTNEEVAEAAKIPLSTVINVLAKYRKDIKLIGKTI
jgi:hypothetical protein